MLKWAPLWAALLIAALNPLLADDSAPAWTADIDPSVSPATDFYHHADGVWLKTTKIPAENATWGTIEILREDEADKVRTLCERASATSTAGASIEQIVGDFYASGMDTDQVSSSGVRPLEFEFDRIDALQTPQQVWAEISHLHAIGVAVAFEFHSQIDPRHSDRVIAQLSQGGMELPNPSYYLDDADAELRTKYAGHVSHMLTIRGSTPASAKTQTDAILRIETALASASLTDADMRDPDAIYHPMTRAELHELAPNLDWDVLFGALDLPGLSSLNVSQPNFVKALAAQVASAPVADWQAYLRWQVLHAFAEALPQPYASENFSFYGTTLQGTHHIAPRWHQVAMTVDALLGDAIGQLYVESFFPAETKARVQRLADQVRTAYRDRLAHLAWMDAPTREHALAKLDAMAIQIGYPDHSRDYSGLSVDRGPYVTNMLKVKAYNSRFDLHKIGRPADRAEWAVTPQAITLAHDLARNAILVPAGYLQPPIYDPQGDLAANYGALGSEIGHELASGFDDLGRKFNARGEREDGWSSDSAAQFDARARRLEQQFDACEPVSGVRIDGRRSSGEDVADLGGLALSFAAFEANLAPADRALANGFTPEQRFFFSYAQLRKAKYHTPKLLLILHADPYPPGQYRTNVPLSNLEEFAQAFSVPAGSPMRLPAADQVSIW